MMERGRLGLPQFDLRLCLRRAEASGPPYHAMKTPLDPKCRSLYALTVIRYTAFTL